jgi:protein involved in polysaccharide export with SLBB domain
MTMLKFSQRKLGAAPRVILAGAIAALLQACAASGSLTGDGQDVTATSVAPVASASTIGNGDKLRITTFNEEQLSGEFVVDEGGAIAFPLIGKTKVVGLTTQQIEQALRSHLSQRFLVNPKINVEVLNQRPFYMLGEIARAGEYPYRPGMNVVGAIATAGGFSPRATTSRVIIRRASGGDQKEYPVQPSTVIYPGDMITIPERLF